MQSRGKLVVLGMFAVALVAATFAWAWNYSRARQCLDFYGGEAARLIRVGGRVELGAPEGQSPIDISKAPGLLNARSSLLDDASYDWRPDSLTAVNEPPDATVRFSDDERAVLLAFDFQNKLVTIVTRGKSARLNNKTAAGWQKFLSRQKRQSPETKPLEPAHRAPSE
jgi:hypothetical protein